MSRTKSLYKNIKKHLDSVDQLTPQKVQINDILTRKALLMSGLSGNYYIVMEKSKVEYGNTFDEVFVVRNMMTNKIHNIPFGEIKGYVRAEVAEEISRIINGEKNV
jgi:hypothetical protein